MTLAQIYSVTFLGLDAYPIEIEVDSTATDETTMIMLVGLPDASVKESKDRVLTAIKNSKFSLGSCYSTINLAPGHLKKEGPFYDLPIALGMLNSLKLIKSVALQDYLIIGELGLNGQVRPVRGCLAMAILARDLGKKGIIVPEANSREAAAVPSIEVYAVKSLREATEVLEASSSIKPISNTLSDILFLQQKPLIDFEDIKGQGHVKRAVEIAAAGNHNIILSGPPGSGKTMIAKALVGIMPPLKIDEALASTKIHSIAGLLPEGQSLIIERPFRAPHHTVSYAGLIGGGSTPRPGEVSLAHNGILFLDELPEFSRTVLEVLRQPLEDRKVTISRANGHFTFPSDFLFIAAMNPCPCGLLGHPDKICKDSSVQVERYRAKISAPLLDRIDMHIDVPPLRFGDMAQVEKGESSEVVRGRVNAARQKQHLRFGRSQANAQMSSQQIKKYCQLNDACLELMRQAIDIMGISARAHDRVIRVARTIADLYQSENIEQDHLMEAINYRQASLVTA